MFRKRSFLISMVLMCAFALAMIALVDAQGPDGRRGPGPARPDGLGLRGWGFPCATRLLAPPHPRLVDRICQELGMTEEQETKARKLIEDLRQKIQSLAEESQPLRDLMAELRADPTDWKKVKRLASQITKQEEAVLRVELDTWMEFEDMLTPDQRRRFWGFLLRRPAPRPGGPVPMGPPPPPAPGA